MNKIIKESLFKSAKYSLAFLWFFTGLTSLYLSPETGYQILEGANITGELADNAIYYGAILDITLGIWLLTAFKTKLCCIIQIGVITLYTLLLTYIDPSYWLHPFGPITKNIPIVILIAYLYSTHESMSYLNKRRHKKHRKQDTIADTKSNAENLDVTDTETTTHTNTETKK
ncbi:DoxX-like family protein [Algibacillus agarilyticus]|uniref:DoxX-like family protein n=1 Tax=Algibacillus agarilyticus TaxID=2234133 RepID=UPI001E5BF47F|nr:DoxX-like family protein [Algibacillus agarilyticus]